MPAAIWNVFNVQHASAKAAAAKAALGDLGSSAAFACEALLVPALKNPIDYWLTSRVPRPESERTLELLVALLRLVFGSPVVGVVLSHPLVLQFATQNRAGVQRFVDEWASLRPSELPCKWPRPVVSKRAWPDAASFFRVHEVMFNSRPALRAVVPKTLLSDVPIAVTMGELLA